MAFNYEDITKNNKVYVIAEMSANHSNDINIAKEIIKKAKECGADCVKVQTYTPDTITIDCDNKYFQIKSGLWENETLYSLYSKAYMPWEWYPELVKTAKEVGIDIFSTPFDKTAVDFLENNGIEFYKIASFEIVDIPLIKYIAQKQKPIIISTGMATKKEIRDAVKAIRSQGNNKIIVLKCSSAYPAKPEEMNLKTISDFQKSFKVCCGLSDHTTDAMSSVIAISMGAKVIEKHFCLSHDFKNPDESFSMDVDEFKAFVSEIRKTEQAVGGVVYGANGKQKENLKFRRSLFVVKDVKKGEIFTEENVRSIRPHYGLKPMYYEEVLGKTAVKDIKKGTPLKWNLIQK